jgi:hypothetical protein
MSKKRKSHVTLPRSFDPGPGYPRETLAYLSPAEHELIRKLTDGKWNRGPKGVKSYADDSASSKGVERKDSNAGLGQGGQNSGKSSGATGGGSKGPGGPSGPNSGPSRSSSTSSSTGGGNKSAPTSGAGGQRGAGSNYGPGSGRPGTASTAGGKAAEVARANAARGGQVSNPVSLSGSMDRGYYHSFTDELPGQTNPTQFDRTLRPTNLVTATHIPYDKFVRGYNPNSLTPGAQKIHQAIVDNALRANQPVEFFSGLRPFNPKRPTKNHPSGQSIDMRMMDPVTGRPVGYEKIGEFARNPIGSYNPSMGRTYQMAQKIQGALEGPYRDFAKGTLNSFMDNPGVYGDFNNQRWGGSFGVNTWKTDPNALDYMHFDEGRVTSAVSADQSALRKEAANYRGPGNLDSGTMLAGGQPIGSPLSGGTQVAGIANVGAGEAARRAKADEALKALSAPTPTLPSDPRIGMPAGAFPAASVPSALKMQDRLNVETPFGSISPAQLGRMAPEDQQRLNQYAQTPTYTGRTTSQVATDPRVSQTPVGAFPAAPKPASVFAGDPRVSTTPLGSLPAAKPKDIQLAWNVPPIGGSLPSWKADALGVWSTNRKPSGPAAQPGTIHSQTASAEPVAAAPATSDTTSSGWKDYLKKKTGVDVDNAVTTVNKKVAELNADPRVQWMKDHPRLAEWGLKMFMAPGGAGGNQNFGNPQDRSGLPYRPQFQQPQMAQAPQASAQQDPLTLLNDLKANMIAQGATPEEIAYVQSIIDELSNSQVA